MVRAGPSPGFCRRGGQKPQSLKTILDVCSNQEVRHEMRELGTTDPLAGDDPGLGKPSNTKRIGKWRVLCNPKFDYFFLGHVIYVISGPATFDFPTPIFNEFHNKIVSSQRNTHSTQTLYTVPPNNRLFRRVFLVACRKRHERCRSLFSSYQVLV